MCLVVSISDPTFHLIVTEIENLDLICVYSPTKQQMLVVINDPEHSVVEEWTLPTKICTKQGDNKPVFIATNFDLNLAL
jgi:hypothetical protein